MVKPNINKAKKHLAKLRELVSKRKHPFSKMEEEEIIKVLHNTREKIWDKKLVTHSWFK